MVLITTEDHWLLEFRDGINLTNLTYINLFACVLTIQYYSKTLSIGAKCELLVSGDAQTMPALTTTQWCIRGPSYRGGWLD